MDRWSRKMRQVSWRMEARLPLVTSRDLQRREAVEDLSYAQPGDEQEREQQDEAAGKDVAPPVRRSSISSSRTPTSTPKLTTPPREADKKSAPMGRSAKMR